MVTNDVSHSTKPHRKRLISSLAMTAPAAFLVAVITVAANPNEGGPIVVLLFLLAIFLFLFSFLFTAARLIVQIFSISKFSLYKLIYVALSLAIGTVFLIGLQTLQQLRLIDVVLVGVFELLLNFYIVRRF